MGVYYNYKFSWCSAKLQIQQKNWLDDIHNISWSSKTDTQKEKEDQEKFNLKTFN